MLNFILLIGFRSVWGEKDAEEGYSAV